MDLDNKVWGIVLDIRLVRDLLVTLREGVYLHLLNVGQILSPVFICM